MAYQAGGRGSKRASEAKAVKAIPKNGISSAFWGVTNTSLTGTFVGAGTTDVGAEDGSIRAASFITVGMAVGDGFASVGTTVTVAVEVGVVVGVGVTVGEGEGVWVGT